MADKDWTGNSVAYMKVSGFSNGALQKREEHDYYATDPKAGEMLLELDSFSKIWECAVGGGHLAEGLARHGEVAKMSDLYPHDCMDLLVEWEQIDFLEFDGEWDGDIITNPPYKFAGEFIEKAMEILKPERKLALWLPIRYLASKGRRKIFEKYPPFKVWVSSSRLICAPNGMFDQIKGSAVDYAWFIWHKGYEGETKLGWFN